MSNPSFYIMTPTGKVERIEGSCIVALGTFDGVHIAHKKLLERAVALKNETGADLAGAWCFSTSPANLINGKNTPSLSTLEEKIALMLSLGLDFVAVGDFSDFRDVSAADFAEIFLKEKLNATGTVCGFNHKFGKGGIGNPQLLEETFGKNHVEVVPEIKVDGETVSSSAIKAHLLQGETEIAAKMLGRAYSLKARVLTGKNLGHTIGFPTANQQFHANTLIPKRGIYASICITEDGKKRVAISNIGIRPTITDGSDNHIINCETHVHDFDENIYGKVVSVEFHRYLREEKKFESIKALCNQIRADLKSSIRYFKGKDEKLS